MNSYKHVDVLNSMYEGTITSVRTYKDTQKEFTQLVLSKQ